MSADSSFNFGYDDNQRVVHEHLDVHPGDPVPGTSTRSQYRLAGRQVSDNIPLPERRRVTASRQPSNLPDVEEEGSSVTSEDTNGALSNLTSIDSLAWDEETEVPNFESTRRTSSGPSTAGRSDKTFNYSGDLSPERPNRLWLTEAEQRINLSRVDTFQADVNRLTFGLSDSGSDGGEDVFHDPDGATPVPGDLHEPDIQDPEQIQEGVADPSDSDPEDINVEDDLPGIIMADQAQLALHRAFIEILDDTLHDDFDSINLDEVEYDYIKDKCKQAEDEKQSLRVAITFMMAHAKDEFNADHKEKTVIQRGRLVDFVNKAQARMVVMRNEQTQAPRNPTEAAQMESRKIKADSVRNYQVKVIDEMKAVTAGLKRLKVSANLDQGEFRLEEEMFRGLGKRAEAAIKEAQRLRSDAVDAGMSDEAKSIEDECRTLQETNGMVSDLVLGQRVNRNLVSSSGGATFKGSDVSPPTFSGDGSVSSDFFKFSEDLKLYTSVKNPSNDELLRILQTKCLKGEALVSCEHMKSKEEIMTYLKATYGNAMLLINQQLTEIRKLGVCTGNEAKMRTWAINARSKLKYVQSLAIEHNLQIKVFNSSIAMEVQARLPTKYQDEFMLELQKIEGGKSLSDERIFNELLTFIGKLVSRLSYRLDLVTRVSEVEIVGFKPAPDKPANNQNKGQVKQQARKSYAVSKYTKKNDNPPPQDKPARIYNVNSKGECTRCKVKHDYFFYCLHFIDATADDRHKLTYQAGTCFRCLLMTGDIPYADRKKWFVDHVEKCNTQWVCTLQKCGEREINRQRHFLLCAYHATSHVAEAENFAKSLDKGKVNPNVKYFKFFNVPTILTMNWNYNAGAARQVAGWETLPDINEPAIYMLCYITVGRRKLLTFFDTGCMTASCTEEVARLLDSETIKEGPIELSVAGGGTINVQSGERRFSLPLADGKTRASFTCICMEEVTTTFPEYDLYEAGEELRSEYRRLYPDGEELPALPDKVGGAAVDLMLGIRYNKFFPRLIYMMENGLSMMQSPFLHTDGVNGILAGPHKSWRQVGECSHVLNRVYSLNPHIPTRIEHVPEHPGEIEHVDVHGDAIDGDGLVVHDSSIIHDSYAACTRQHCSEHESDVYDIPPTWEMSSRIYNSLTKDKVTRFIEGEQLGTSVDYRCPACRNCISCKRGELLEQVSLVEEREQYAIEQSVRYDRVGKKLIARLPFMVDPVAKLTPNLHIAKKVFCSQLRKATNDETVRLGMVKSFNKLCDKGYVAKVSDLPTALQNKVNSMVGYVIPWRTVCKEDSISTPVRLVFDASSKTPGGESLNDALAKGINTLGNLFSILVRFRLKKEGFTGDVSMAYNGVHLDPDHVAYQKFLWAEEMKDLSPLELWVVLTLIYGVRSAGGQTIEGFNKLADEVDKYPELHQASIGALVLRKDAYMDDLVSPQDTKADCILAANQLKYVLSLGGMGVKEITYSGNAPTENVSTDGKHVGVLGMQWDSEKDLLRVNICELFLGKRKRGKTPETIEDDRLEQMLGKKFTRRILVGKVASVYDPLGLLVPITAKYKLQLAEICKLKLGWDDPIPPGYLKQWCTNIHEIQTLGSIYFSRSIIPEDAANTDINYIVSSDASEEIAICCVHSRILKTDGTFHVQILAAKSKVITKLTVPRAELKGVVTGSALGYCIAKDTGSRVGDIIHVTDSSICLFWLNEDQRPLKTGVRNAVLEVRRLTDLNSWFHVQSEDNVADIGTRADIPVDMSSSSLWIGGKLWMRKPRAQMPLKNISEIKLNNAEKSAAALEVKNQDIQGIFLHSLITKVGQRHSFSNYLMDPTRYPWPKSVRVMATVLRFIDKTLPRKWNRPWFPESSTSDIGNVAPTPGVSVPPIVSQSVFSKFEIQRAENYFFFKSTLEVKQFGKKQDWVHCTLSKQKILLYNSRIVEGQKVENCYREGLDVAPLMFVKPVCDRYSPVAYSIMSHCHSTLARHRNVAETLRQSYSIAYVYGGRDLAIEIRENCPFCTRFKQRLLTREMGSLHDNRFIIAPPFYSVQCDMFGPLEAICEHSHRSTVKVWGLVFKDPSCGAIAVYTMTRYDTAAFIMGYTRHAARYGHPVKVVIDAGSQVVKAVTEMHSTILDVEGIIRLQHQVGVSFEIVPVGSHYQNGVVERGIKEVKGLFKQLYNGLRMDIMSYETAFAFIANEINCFPTCLGSRTKDLDNLDIITPSRLIHGRNNRRCLSGFARADLPSKVMRQMEQTTQAWWEVWQTQWLSHYITQPRKWLESGGKVDIVVFLKSPTEMAVGEPVWRVGRVVDLVEGRKGQSRGLTIEYRNANEKVFRATKVDTRQAAVLHHEGELELVDMLNEASRVNNVHFSMQTINPSHNSSVFFTQTADVVGANPGELHRAPVPGELHKGPGSSDSV